MISIPSKLSLLSSVWPTCTHPNNGKLLHDMVFSYFFGHRQVLIRRLTDHLAINIPFHFHIMVKPSKQGSQLLAEWHTCMNLQYFHNMVLVYHYLVQMDTNSWTNSKFWFSVPFHSYIHDQHSKQASLLSALWQTFTYPQILANCYMHDNWSAQNQPGVSKVDGTADLNSFQLHSWQWIESTRTPPSYLGTTWRVLH